MAEISFTQILVIFFAAALTSNIVLSDFLGLCSFFSLSGEFRTSVLMGISVAAVTFVSSILNLGIYRLILVPGAALADADLRFLSFIVFIVLIAGLVQFLEWFLERKMPDLAGKFGPFLALITVNCAIMGVSLFIVDPVLNYNVFQGMAFALGSGAGWLLVITMMAGLRIKLEKTGNVPVSLTGMGINLLITGIMAMVFMGFSGMIDL